MPQARFVLYNEAITITACVLLYTQYNNNNVEIRANDKHNSMIISLGVQILLYIFCAVRYGWCEETASD